MKYLINEPIQTDTVVLNDLSPMERKCSETFVNIDFGDNVIVMFLAKAVPTPTSNDSGSISLSLNAPIIVKSEHFLPFIERNMEGLLKSVAKESSPESIKNT